MSSGTTRTVGIMALGLATGGIAAGIIAGGALAGTAFGSILVGAAYMGGSFLGQMIFPASNPRDMPSAPGYPMQTVDKGSPVKLTYGTLRVAGNLVWMGPLSHYHVSGGKGGGDDGPENYRRSFLISICEGPRSVLRMWKGKTEIDITLGSDNKTGTIGSLFAGVAQEVTVFNGDGYNEGLETLIGEDYSNYKYDCCVLFKNYDLGPQESIPAFVFEVGPWAVTNYYLQTGRGLGVYDADGNWIYSVSGTPTINRNMQIDMMPNGDVLFNKTNETGFMSVYYRSADGTTRDLMPYAASGTSPFVKAGWYDTDDHGNIWSARACGCAFDPTGDYAICSAGIVMGASGPGDTYSYVYKINVHTGELVWAWSAPLKGTPSKVRVVSGGEAYVLVNAYNNGPSVALIVSTGGKERGTRTLTVGNSYVYDLWIDEDFVIVDPDTGEVMTGFIFASGLVTLVSTSYHFVHWEGLTDSYEQIVYVDGHPAVYGWDSGFNNVRTFNNLIYASGTRQYNSPNHAIQIYNGWGSLIGGFDPGPESDPPDPDYQPSGYGCSMDSNGRIAFVVTNYGAQFGTLYILSAATLTEISNAQVACWDDANVVGETMSFPPYADPFDANPVDIIYDLVTNRRYGAGMPSEYINGTSFSAIRAYCQEEDLLISVEINSSRSVIDWIQFICSHFGGFPFWVGGELYLGAWRAEDPAFHITRDHLVVDEDGGIPVQIKKRDYSQSVNHIELGWQDRDNIYGPAVAPFRDDVDIRLSGKRRKKQISLPGIKREELATKMGWRYLIDSMYRFSIYTFKLGAKDMLLMPGMVGLISDGFKLTDQRIRLTSISEAKDGIGLEVEAVDDISDLYPDLSARQVQTSLWVPPKEPTLADLEDATLTMRESEETGELYLSIAPGGEYTDGYRVYTSWDGITYEFAERVHTNTLTGGEANSIGTTLTTLPAESTSIWRPDQSLTVDIGTLTDLKTDVTAATFFAGGSLAKVGDEIIGFRTAVETATEGQWIISELIRGMYGTTPSAHAIGERFATLDADSTLAFSSSDIGRTMYVKILASYGPLSQSLSDVEATDIVIKGIAARPLGANLVRLTSDEMDGWDNTYSGDAITLYWGLPGRDSGYNLGGYDGGGTWAWGDDELELVPQNGILWGAYAQDPELEAVDLEFRHESGTLLGSETLGVVSTTTISKATDLGGNNPATIQVYPVRSRRAIRPEAISVDDGS